MGYIHHHTGSEWEVIKNQSFQEIREKNVPFNGMIISVHHHDKNCESVSFCEEAIANAKLISQAPKLLQVAEMFFDSLPNGSMVKDIVGKIITDSGVEWDGGHNKF